MPLAQELESWLADLAKEGALDAEAVASLRTTFDANPKAAEYAKGSVLRQSDYSRHIAEAKKREQDLDQQKTQLDSLLADTTSRTATDEAKWQAEIKRQVARAQAAEQKLLAAQQKLRDEYSATDDTLKDIGLDSVMTQPPANQSAQNDTADTRYVAADKFGEFEKAAREIYPLIPATLSDLNAKHIKLYGTPMEGATALVTESIKTGRTMTELADEKFGFAKRQAELDQQQRQREVDDAIKAARVTWESEHAMASRGAATGLQGTRLGNVIRPANPGPVSGDMQQQVSRVAAVLANREARNAG